MLLFWFAVHFVVFLTFQIAVFADPAWCIYGIIIEYSSPHLTVTYYMGDITSALHRQASAQM